MPLLPRFRKLLAERRASIMIEFAFAAPLLITLIFGGVELARYMLTYQKLSRVAMGTADLSSQGQTITEGEIANVFAAAENVSGAVDFGSNGRLILTAVYRDGENPPSIDWQRSFGADLGEGSASKIGVPSGGASLPAAIQLAPGEGLIVAEAYYRHTVFLFDKFINPGLVYQTALYRPRFGALRKIDPDPQ
ncbi:MAG: TadE/TadG family type IV pilus assembly protein [Pseudomonadota bacterium]